MQDITAANNKYNPYGAEISANTPKQGMYITKNSVYMLYEKNGNFSLYKNYEKYLDLNNIIFKTNGAISRLEWNYGKSYTSDIQCFYKMLDFDTLMQGMNKIADTLDNKGINVTKYYTYVDKFFRGEQQELLNLFKDCESVDKFEKYKKYNQGQYGIMSLLIKAVKQTYPVLLDKFVNDQNIRKILHDMAIDTNGLASQVENKANEDKPSIGIY